MPLPDHRRHVAIGRREHAHVDVNLGRPAHMPERRRVQNAQEFRLRARADLADFVEENGPAMGDLEQARLGAIRAGERAALVSEQLALQQPLL